MSKQEQEIHSLLSFLDKAPTAWHAVALVAKDLIKHGFTELKEDAAWKLKPSGKYFVIRNGSSISAFILPKKAPLGLFVAASHTDSPSFKLKPNAEFIKENMVMLGLEIYGSPMLSSWLNRDLGIAGRIIYTDRNGAKHEKVITIDDAALIIPQLAIHLDRQVNEAGPVINKQEHLAALAGLDKPRKTKTHYLENLIKRAVPFKDLLSYDLFVYPLEKARLVGMSHEFISSYRIDSLASVHAVLAGFLASDKPDATKIKMAVFWDNEEIGSNTAQGAGSPFLPHVVERITLALGMTREDYFRLLSQSLCASVDLAHAQHPNYGDKHEPRHQALMNGGIVIKSSAQHRYASDARSASLIVSLCKAHHIPFQRYVARGDIPCGTTVGPIHANLTGMSTVDIGSTQLSMHSARELTGVADHLSLLKLIKSFFAA